MDVHAALVAESVSFLSIKDDHPYDIIIVSFEPPVEGDG